MPSGVELPVLWPRCLVGGQPAVCFSGQGCSMGAESVCRGPGCCGDGCPVQACVGASSLCFPVDFSLLSSPTGNPLPSAKPPPTPPRRHLQRRCCCSRAQGGAVVSPFTKRDSSSQPAGESSHQSHPHPRLLPATDVELPRVRASPGWARECAQQRGQEVGEGQARGPGRSLSCCSPCTLLSWDVAAGLPESCTSAISR